MPIIECLRNVWLPVIDEVFKQMTVKIWRAFYSASSFSPAPMNLWCLFIAQDRMSTITWCWPNVATQPVHFRLVTAQRRALRVRTMISLFPDSREVRYPLPRLLQTSVHPHVKRSGAKGASFILGIPTFGYWHAHDTKTVASLLMQKRSLLLMQKVPPVFWEFILLGIDTRTTQKHAKTVCWYTQKPLGVDTRKNGC